jgi:hypothetical protein
MRTLLALMWSVCLTLLILPGCGPTIHKFSRDGPDGENDHAFKRDVYECNQSSVAQYDRTRMGTAGVIFFERDMNTCLNARGWKETPNGKDTYYFDEWWGQAFVK